MIFIIIGAFLTIVGQISAGGGGWGAPLQIGHPQVVLVQQPQVIPVVAAAPQLIQHQPLLQHGPVVQIQGGWAESHGQQFGQPLIQPVLYPGGNAGQLQFSGIPGGGYQNFGWGLGSYTGGLRGGGYGAYGGGLNAYGTYGGSYGGGLGVGWKR